MRVCLSIPEVDQGLVLDACTALARYNARTYKCAAGEACTRSPWHLVYDASAGDSTLVDGHPTIIMRDAVTLMRVGHGACGELSSAYAGWLMSRGYDAALVAPQTRSDDDVKGPAWHVMVRYGRGIIIDPRRPETLKVWRQAHGVR